MMFYQPRDFSDDRTHVFKFVDMFFQINYDHLNLCFGQAAIAHAFSRHRIML